MQKLAKRMKKREMGLNRYLKKESTLVRNENGVSQILIQKIVIKLKILILFIYNNNLYDMSEWSGEEETDGGFKFCGWKMIIHLLLGKK